MEKSQLLLDLEQILIAKDIQVDWELKADTFEMLDSSKRKLVDWEIACNDVAFIRQADENNLKGCMLDEDGEETHDLPGVFNADQFHVIERLVLERSAQ